MTGHEILINHLEKLVGLSDCVLNWFKTYIKKKKCDVSLGDHVSEEQDICFGVAQQRSCLYSHYTCCHRVLSLERTMYVSIGTLMTRNCVMM